MIVNIGFLLGIALVTVCFGTSTARLNGNSGLPAPAFSMNLTQDNNVGLEKHVFRRLGAAKNDDPSLAPMFEGLGTHYSFIWVGTPAQRVSVIMDTGSHHTAFPCTGCKCGKHMDPHFDPKQSSSSSIKSCGGEGKKCYFKQSYTEGSSWSAFKVRDKVWVGGPGKEDILAANARSIDFDFGCQESETGLFRTQKVDGIMGLSAAPDTLPFQLHATGLTKTKMFGLCFRTGGGVVTLGGVDTQLHLPQQRGLSAEQYRANRTSTGGVLFAALLKPKGWYTVKLVDVLMRPNTGTGGADKAGIMPQAKSIGGDASRYNAGKGTIVDSGTTDTYLPASLRAQFQALFRSLTGREYGNKQAFYSKEQFAKLPVIVFRLMGEGGVGTLDLEVFPTSYMEHHKEGTAATGAGGRYTPRIYLTEGTGAVLGANAIHEHNVIFDPDGMRVGFARSRCTYDKDHSVHDFATSTNAPSAPAVSAAIAPAKPQLTKEKAAAPPKDAAPKKSPPSAPKPPVATAPKKDTKNSVPKQKHKPVSVMKQVAAAKPGTGMLFTVELTIIQKEALSSLVEAAADSLVRDRYAPCRPVLAMPCNARCDRQPGPESQILDFGISKSSESRLEYLQVDSAGTVSVGSASLIKGQQYWKVPSCDSTTSAARRALDADKAASGASLSIPADWTAVGVADELNNAGLDAEEAEELRAQQLQHRIVPEQCAVVCPLFVPSGDAALDAVRALPVRVNAKAAVDYTTTACDADTQTRKRLTVRNALLDTDAQPNVLTLGSSTGGDSKVLCYSVLNAKAVKGAAPTTNAQVDSSEDTRAKAPAKCKTAAVEEESCRPYFFNCTAPATLPRAPSAAELPPTSDINDVVVAVHMRLKGMHYSSLPAHQEADLINAFASIFKVRALSVSLVMSPPAAGFSFSSRSQTSVQVVIRVNPAAADGLVTAELLQMVTRISAAKKTAKKPASAVQRSLMSAQVAQLVRAVVTRPTFPEVLAAAVTDASGNEATENARHGWLVAGGISFVGASALHGDVVGAKEQALSSQTDADTCAAANNPWKEYFALAGSSLLARADLAAQATGGHTALLYSVVSFAVGLGLLAAGVVMARRYFREKERTSRESSSSSSGGNGNGGRRGAKNVSDSAVSSPSGGSDESDLEASTTPTNSQKSNLSAHRDRRRKVLQKFSFKR